MADGIKQLSVEEQDKALSAKYDELFTAAPKFLDRSVLDGVDSSATRRRSSSDNPSVDPLSKLPTRLESVGYTTVEDQNNFARPPSPLRADSNAPAPAFRSMVLGTSPPDQPIDFPDMGALTLPEFGSSHNSTRVGSPLNQTELSQGQSRTLGSATSSSLSSVSTQASKQIGSSLETSTPVSTPGGRHDQRSSIGRFRSSLSSGVVIRGPCRVCGQPVTTDQPRSKGTDGIYTHDQCPPIGISEEAEPVVKREPTVVSSQFPEAKGATYFHMAVSGLNAPPPLDSKERSLERECLRREYLWLLEDELPDVYRKLANLLQECLDMLTMPAKLKPLHGTTKLPQRPQSISDDVPTEELPSSPPARQRMSMLSPSVMRKKTKKSVIRQSSFGLGSSPELIRLVMEGGATVGTAKVDETSITKLKLDWKLPKGYKHGSGVHIDVQLQKGMSLSLEQLRATINKIKLSLAEIHTKSNCKDQQNSSVMENLLELLISAKESLTTAIQRVCEKTIHRGNFSPSLPKDVLLDTYIDHGELCIEAALFVEVSAPHAATRHSHSLVPRRVGAQFQDDAGRCCEVYAIHRAYGTIPILSSVLSNLFVMVDFAQKTQDKLLVFQEMNLKLSSN